MSQIVIDTSHLSKIVAGLEEYEKQMPGAAISAVNRTLDYINTRVGKLVASEYRITAKEVRSTITKTRASKGKLLAYLKSRGRRLTLGRFVYGRPTKRAVRVKVKKNDRAKPVTTDPKAFVQILSGQRQVLKRQGKKRLPVDVLRSITIPQMIDSVNVQNKLQEEANKKLAERIDHEIQYRLKKVSAK